ncbi:MAG: hypothetical protein HFJ10_07120 [Lachnospiraceae bacterium]|nr:hypothetical protein [Lachnospiraceae bacterium]
MAYGLKERNKQVKIFQDPDWRFPLNERKKLESLSYIHQETACKRIRYVPSFTEFIWNELRFQSWKHWLLQGSLLLAALCLALFLRKMEATDIETLAACSVLFVFAGNLILSSIARLFSWHMAELEQTLYVSLKQMVCIRMLEAGITDLMILAVFLGTLGGHTMDVGSSLLYMLVPFLWSDTLYLHMLVCFRNTSNFRSLGQGVLCGMMTLIPLMWESVYDPEWRGTWLLLAAAGIFLLTAEVFHIFGKIERGDNICLN